MMNSSEKYIGEGKPVGDVKDKIKIILKDLRIDTQNLKDKSVTEDKLADGILEAIAESASTIILSRLEEKIVADRFGEDPTIAISQRLMTDTVNDIYGKIRDLVGEPPVGLYLTATPEYYIGEEGARVHIEAVSTSGVFEHVAFYLDDELLPGAEARSVYRFSYDTEISRTSTIKCTATILGITHTVSKVITHYDSFWLGAGASYTDIMNLEHNIPIGSTLRGAYDVDCRQGDHIILIVGDALRGGFLRADLNGFEIPFDCEMITKDGNSYWVYTSKEVYVAGRYNIDING